MCVCAPGAIWFKFPSLDRFGPPRWSEGERFGPPPEAIWSPRFGSASLSRGRPWHGWRFLLVISIGSRILPCSLSSLSLGLRRFQWRLLAFRIERRIPKLARLFIIFGFSASIRNIWIRESSLDSPPGRCAWTCWLAVDAGPNTKPTICTLRGQGAQCGESLLCRAVWRIHPLIIVTGESKATRTGLHGPPPYLDKESV